FLEMAREMSGYNEVMFPPCCCTTRTASDVIMVVRFSSLLMTADPPSAEMQVEICWEDVIEYHVVDGGRAFQFSFKREGKRAKPIKLFSNYKGVFEMHMDLRKFSRVFWVWAHFRLAL
ncbi:hypothetical protein TELCIR_22291, partial [Teladorsagia circumcincta]